MASATDDIVESSQHTSVRLPPLKVCAHPQWVKRYVQAVAMING